MTFTFRVYYVYYEDDSFMNYGEVRFKTIRAKDKYKALKVFKDKFGINPLYAV